MGKCLAGMAKVVSQGCRIKGMSGAETPGVALIAERSEMTSPLNDYRTKADWLAAAIAAHNSDKCLLWPFGVDRDGYGLLTFHEQGKIKRTSAHRLAFRLTHDRWPEPCGLHSCDTPR